MITDLEKKIISAIQSDLEISVTPYKSIADKLDISEQLLINTLNHLCNKKIIRRFGATIRHQKSGFSANAMVAWNINKEKVDRTGEILAQFPAVTHCYHRIPTSTWPYNLYTMIHAQSKTACEELASDMATKVNTKEYTLLFSRRELKKTSMIYFPTT